MTEQQSDASTAGVITSRTLFPFLEISLVNSGFRGSHQIEGSKASEEAAESSAQR
jgi:hypothetical protein